MEVNITAKSLVFDFFRLKPVNFFLKSVLPQIPAKWFDRIPFIFPIRGKFTVKISDTKFLLVSDGMDPIASQIFYRGELWNEGETFTLLKEFIPQFANFFDIGANTGLYSLFATTVKPDLSIHAFEPVKKINSYFSENIKANGFKNIRANSCALGDSNGEFEIWVPQSISLPSASSFSDNHRRPGSSPEKCRCMRLDDYVRENHISGKTLLKVDTERTEPQVFLGGTDFIGSEKPWIICEVLDSQVGSEIHKVLGQFGYSYYSIRDRMLKEEKIPTGNNDGYFNYLFVPNDKESLNLIAAFVK